MVNLVVLLVLGLFSSGAYGVTLLTSDLAAFDSTVANTWNSISSSVSASREAYNNATATFANNENIVNDKITAFVNSVKQCNADPGVQELGSFIHNRLTKCVNRSSNAVFKIKTYIDSLHPKYLADANDHKNMCITLGRDRIIKSCLNNYLDIIESRSNIVGSKMSDLLRRYADTIAMYKKSLRFCYVIWPNRIGSYATLTYNQNGCPFVKTAN